MTSEEIAQAAATLVERTTSEQGLPLKVQDETTFKRVAEILTAADVTRSHDEAAPAQPPIPQRPAAMRPFNPHPIKAHLVMSRITQAEVARRLRCSTKWVNLCVNGEVAIPERFKTDVAALLGQPADVLFRDESEGGQ